MGIVYLIQPAELVGTDRAKVGCSTKSDLSPVLHYKKGTNYLCICSTENPLAFERVIIAIFKSHFTKIAGNFMGDINEMRKIFLQQIVAHDTFTKSSMMTPLNNETMDDVSENSLESLAIQNEYTTRGDIGGFVRDFLRFEKRWETGCFITLKELKELYRNSKYYDGKLWSLRNRLERVFEESLGSISGRNLFREQFRCRSDGYLYRDVFLKIAKKSDPIPLEPGWFDLPGNY